MNSVLPQILRAVPSGEDEPDAEVAPEPAPSPAGLPALTQGGQLAWHEQAQAVAWHAFRVAWRRGKDLSERDGGMVRELLAGKPPSVLEQHEYAQSRAWVPAGHDGGLAEGMGVVFHALLGRPGVAFGNAVSAVHARPFRWCVAAALIFGTALIALAALGHILAAVLMAAVLAVLAVLWAGAGALYVRLRSPRARESGS